MQTLTLPFWSTLVSLAVATNTSIHFFSDRTGCINDWFGCGNLPVGWCCASLNPYCQWVTCDNCHAQRLNPYELPTHKNGNCSGGTATTPTCTSTTIDNCCAVEENANPDICSAMIVPTSGQDAQKCLGMMEPDTFAFTDEMTSQDAQLHLLNGTYQQAVTFATRKDYGGLRRFPGS